LNVLDVPVRSGGLEGYNSIVTESSHKTSGSFLTDTTIARTD